MQSFEQVNYHRCISSCVNTTHSSYHTTYFKQAKVEAPPGASTFIGKFVKIPLSKEEENINARRPGKDNYIRWSNINGNRQFQTAG